MNRSFRLTALALFVAASPAFAHTWTINGQKVEGDFVKEGHESIRAKNGKLEPVAVVFLEVGGSDRSYPFSKLSSADRKYEQEQVAEQKRTVAEVEERKWKDVQGGTTVGRLVGMDKDKIVLLISTKVETRRRPFDKFTFADQDYVRTEMTARGEGAIVPKKAPRQLAQATGPNQPSGQPKPQSKKKPKKPKKPVPSSAAPQNTPSPNPVQPAAVAAATAVQPHDAVVAPASSPPAGSATATKQQAAAFVTQLSDVKQELPTPAVITTSRARCAARNPSCAAKSLAGTHSAPSKCRVCSHCGFRLPVTCKAGDDCPNCGARFAYEEMGESRITAPATLRSMGAPAGLVSLLGVVAVTVLRARWYLLHS
jgi:hypothetical protein